MLKHLYKNFLHDINEYRASEDFWRGRWEQNLDSGLRSGWSYPWISTGSPDCLDGNPIFSAVSPSLRRGIRVIQHEPTSRRVELCAWPDYVGGSLYDPDAIQELVISCALSDAAVDLAMLLIQPWVRGLPICFDMKEDPLGPEEPHAALRNFGVLLLPAA